MKLLLLFIGLLLAAVPAIAQNAAVAPPDLLPAAQAAPDTAAAIHRLFTDRRKTSHILTGIIAGGGTVVLLGDGLSNGALYLALAAPYEIAILLIYRPYTKKAEARALAALQAHRLSPKLKKRLKAKYFR